MNRESLVLAVLTILIWSSLAFLGTGLTHVPPILIVGISLLISGMVGLIRIRSWWVSLPVFVVGVYGIFGYHFLLFSAFQNAPAVEANLINYLWPLFIVVFSPFFFKGYRLRGHHIIGALTGMTGAGLIVTGGRLTLDPVNSWGYLLALAAAFVWSTYSLASKKLPPYPTGAVGGFCLASGILSLAVYFFQTPTLSSVAALSPRDWLYLCLLGIGPMGGAFFLWDAAMKKGDPRIIGSLAYLTPLFSTLVLVFGSHQPLTRISLAAMLLIITGAVIGSLDVFRRGPKTT
ncbi:MAG: DMT family transporter [bacterium]